MAYSDVSKPREGLIADWITHKVSRPEIMSRRRQNLSYDGDAAPSNDMEAALVRSTAVPRVEDGVDTRRKVRRCCQEKCLHAGIAQCLHDGREEVCSSG